MVVKHRWTQKSLNVVMTHNDIRILAFITITITIIVTITIKVNEYPWMVGLYTRTASLPSCGGSLINSKYYSSKYPFLSIQSITNRCISHQFKVLLIKVSLINSKYLILITVSLVINSKYY